MKKKNNREVLACATKIVENGCHKVEEDAQTDRVLVTDRLVQK